MTNNIVYINVNQCNVFNSVESSNFIENHIKTDYVEIPIFRNVSVVHSMCSGDEKFDRMSSCRGKLYVFY